MFGICNSLFQDNPGKKINFGDFSKLCGQKWQQMDENDREDFEEKANEVMCPILPVLNLPFPVYNFFFRTRKDTNPKWPIIFHHQEQGVKKQPKEKRIQMHQNDPRLHFLSFLPR